MMRTGGPRTTLAGRSAVIAVTPTAQITPTALAEQFETAGYEVAEHSRISRSRSDRAVVLSAVSPRTTVSTTQSVMLDRRIVGSRPALTLPEFQPVWSVRQWGRIGLEVYVVDDNDAFVQLDVLADGIRCPRDDLTIKPRAGWQGYGHPDVQKLG